MINFSNGGVMIESEEEMELLPTSATNLYMDFETTSYDDKERSTNPWGKCWILGIALKADDGTAFYISVRHEQERYNIPLEVVKRYMAQLMSNTQNWVNHNIKYDVQVLFKDFGIDCENDVKYVCTLEAAKMIDSDRYTFGLKGLSKDWLNEDISKYEKAFDPYLERSEDYGRVPADIMAEYACQDVITEEKLWLYCQEHMPEVSWPLFETSCRLQYRLIQMERKGMYVDVSEVKRAELEARAEMMMIQEQIKAKVGYIMEPNNTKDCEELLVDTLGFPVLEWQENPRKDGTRGPKFNKDALRKYKALPGMDTELIDLMLRYRRMHTFVSLFTSKFVELQREGRLNCSFNPTVSTGRMSCASPNMQQCSEEAKKLIRPGPGMGLICADYSQIEYRMIVHYINNSSCINAYLDDPETDFHIWVKDACKVHRKPAKTINFLMGYGGGKKLLIDSLVLVPELVEELWSRVPESLEGEQRDEYFMSLARDRALEVYEIYHSMLPELKHVSTICMKKCKYNGFVTNLYGRVRRLPARAAYRAFNNVCQGTSADLMKERMVHLGKWFDEYHPYCQLNGVVHDEVAIECPLDRINDELIDSICFVLEDVRTDLRVPIRTAIGWSANSWWEAAEDNNAKRSFCRIKMRQDFLKKYPKYFQMSV